MDYEICKKCGRKLNGSICFTTMGMLCSKCYGKYILSEIQPKKRKTKVIKDTSPMSEELRKKPI